MIFENTKETLEQALKSAGKILRSQYGKQVKTKVKESISSVVTEAEMDALRKLSKRVGNIRATNSLFDYCYVADGRMGATLNQCTKIWDIAAAWLLIREAGGIVSDIDGKEIIFNISASGVDQNYTIAASGKGIHRDIIKTIDLK